jgi:hypothetical protein
MVFFDKEHVIQIYNSLDGLMEQYPFVDNEYYIEKTSTILFDKTCFQLFMSLKMDFGGHSKGKYDGLTLEEYSSKNPEIFKAILNRGYTIIEIAFEKHCKNKLNIDLFEELIILLSKRFVYSNLYCYECHEPFSLYIKNDSISYISNYIGEEHKPCAVGNEEIKITSTMKFPSGKMVVANNLCVLFDKNVINGSDEYIYKKSGLRSGINSHKGKQLHHEYWNKLGLSYIFTGNSNPNIFSRKDGNVIFKHKYDNSCDSAKSNHDEVYHGDIVTGLWAVCAMDYNRLETLCKANGVDPERFIHDSRCIIVDVLNNVKYDVTDYTNIDDNLFATFVPEK